MKLKDKIRYKLLILVLLSVFSMFALKRCFSTSEQEIMFEILEKGDLSGYCEEAYLVVKTKVDWITIWERHTIIREPGEQPPEIDFSKNFVICAFMGKHPTTDYSIDVEKVWTDGERVFVEVVRRGPLENLAGGEMITCPYVMILVEKIDMDFVFHVIDKNWETFEHLSPEFPSATIVVILFVVLLAVIVVLKKKAINARMYF